MSLAEILSLTAIGISFIMLIWLVVVAKRYQDIQRRYRKLLHGANVANIEEILLENHKNYNILAKYKDELEKSMAELTAKVELCTQKIAVVRYNPFTDIGSDQSFSAAFLNDHQDGIVFSSIYSSFGAQTFAKPIVKGKSKYRLSKEEQQAIDEAAAG